MGSNLQLGSGSEDDQWVPNKVTGKQLKGQKVIDASVRGQHSVLLVTSDTASKYTHLCIVNLCLYTCISHYLVVNVNKVWEKI